MSMVQDPCVAECFKPNSQWRFTDISECLARCREVAITKP